MTAALSPMGRIFDALFNPGCVLFALAILAIYFPLGSLGTSLGSLSSASFSSPLA